MSEEVLDDGLVAVVEGSVTAGEGTGESERREDGLCLTDLYSAVVRIISNSQSEAFQCLVRLLLNNETRANQDFPGQIL